MDGSCQLVPSSQMAAMARGNTERTLVHHPRVRAIIFIDPLQCSRSEKITADELWSSNVLEVHTYTVDPSVQISTKDRYIFLYNINSAMFEEIINTLNRFL